MLNNAKLSNAKFGRCRSRTVFLVVAALLLGQIAVVPVALAWNESGHRAIAAAAAKQMSPELRAKVVAALQAHPRYTEGSRPQF